MTKRSLPMLGSGIRVLDTRSVKPEPKQVEAFYVSREWRRLVEYLKRQRGERCEQCGRTGTRLFADHVVEIKDGGPLLDPRGIRLLCGSCHGGKTHAERRRRMRQ
jgi:5-methylcytosine-specific restriction enzyme A